MTIQATQCPVLYDESGLLIIHKPEGVLSHPNPGFIKQRSDRSTKTRCAFEGSYDFDRRCFRSPAGSIWLLHRLDQDTSGILVAARTETVAKGCRIQFEQNQVAKQYTALAAGLVKPPQGAWNDFIVVEKKEGRVRSQCVRSRQTNAKLSYHRQHYFPGARFSLLEVHLITGKTHQIRVQASVRGAPIAGDELYGDFLLNRRLRKEIGLRRLFLHAGEIKLKHPVTGQWLHIRDPLPEELEEVLDRLG